MPLLPKAQFEFNQNILKMRGAAVIAGGKAIESRDAARYEDEMLRAYWLTKALGASTV